MQCPRSATDADTRGLHDMGFGRDRPPWRRCVKCVKVISVLTLCVLLISPLRNFILSPVLPGHWRDHNSFRIISVLFDNQNFLIDDPFCHTGSCLDFDLRVPRMKVNMSDIAKFYQSSTLYEEFYAQRSRLSKEARHSSEAAATLKTLEGFRPSLDQKERTQLMFTMDVFVRACLENGLTFFLIGGSLLGAFRHHGMIPWDDDVDVAMNASQWKRARAVLGNIPGFTLYARGDVQWKFYLSDLPPFRDKPFKFPSLDLFFFKEDDTHLYGLTWGLKYMIMHKRHVLPLRKIRWEYWDLPAPACIERVLLREFDTVSTCVTPYYDHKHDKKLLFSSEQNDCSFLYSVYPFVFRHPGPTTRNTREGGQKGQGKSVVEVRRVGDSILEQISVPAESGVCLE